MNNRNVLFCRREKDACIFHYANQMWISGKGNQSCLLTLSMLIDPRNKQNVMETECLGIEE